MISPDEKQRRLDAYAKGLTDQEIARELGLSHSTVAYWRTRANLPNNLKPGIQPQWSKAETWKLLKLANQCSAEELAAIFGRSKHSIEMKAYRMRIKIRKTRKRAPRDGPDPKQGHRRILNNEEKYKLAMLQGMLRRGRQMVPTATPAEIVNAAIEAIRTGYAKKFFDTTEL